MASLSDLLYKTTGGLISQHAWDDLASDIAKRAREAGRPETGLEFYKSLADVVGRSPRYQPVGLIDPGKYEGISPGGYERLERSLVHAYEVPLQRAFKRTQAEIESNIGARRIPSSNIEVMMRGESQRNLADAMAQAVDRAIAARYGLQAQDVRARNEFNLRRAQQLNQAGLESSRGYTDFLRTAGGLASEATRNRILAEVPASRALSAAYARDTQLWDKYGFPILSSTLDKLSRSSGGRLSAFVSPDSTLGKWLANLENAGLDTGKLLWDVGSDIIGGGGQTLSDLFSGNFSRVPGDIWETLKLTGGDIWDGLKSVFS